VALGCIVAWTWPNSGLSRPWRPQALFDNVATAIRTASERQGFAATVVFGGHAIEAVL
jgi:hypothetical protein